MTKFRGTLGFNRGTKETSSGIYQMQTEEVEVSGDIRNVGARWPNAGLGNDVSLKHVLSIVAPESDIALYSEVVYILWQGRKWSVLSIAYKRPRIELSFGGLYNG